MGLRRSKSSEINVVPSIEFGGGGGTSKHDRLCRSHSDQNGGSSSSGSRKNSDNIKYSQLLDMDSRETTTSVTKVTSSDYNDLDLDIISSNIQAHQAAITDSLL